MTVDKLVGKVSSEAVAWRHHLHAHPELQFEETATADFIAEKLASFGLDVIRGLGGTGLVSVIDGARGVGRSLGFRAELDALPIAEQTNLVYASRADGVMHACGHDGHMAMLLGAAKILSDNRDFAGRVVLIFQPAEEFGGGGKRMIEDGLFEKFDCDEVYSIHNMPGMPEGQVSSRYGPILAAARSWDLTITGKGAHAGWPHTGIDSIAVAMAFVSGCNAIVSREIDPVKSAVISPTQIHAGSAYNVMPATVHAGGTIRALDDAVMDLVGQKMQQLARGLAIARGCDIVLAINPGYPVTENHREQVDRVLGIARGLYGPEHVDTAVDPKMGTDDFSFMLADRPGAYVFLGAGDCPPLHNEGYDFNDRIVEPGIRLWVSLALRS